MSVQTQYIKNKWPGKLLVFEFDEATNTMTASGLSSGSNCMDYGEIASSSYRLESSTEKFKNQNGLVVATDSTYEGVTEAVIMQTSKELINWNALTVRGKKYVQYLFTGYKGGLYQGVWSIVEIEPLTDITAPGGTTSFKYKSTSIIKTTAVTLSTAQTTAMRVIGNPYPYTVIISTDTAVTIPINQEFVVVEATS
jgi:hypothetical protein